MATSLASVLETQVPEFGVNVDDDEFYANMAEWLAEQGYRYRERPVTGSGPKGYHLILGKSPRGGRHAIVGKNGEPVWDPHPEDGTGRFLASREAFGILIPLEDSRMAHDSEVPQEYREMMLPVEFRTGTCPGCGNEATLNMDGTVAEHGTCGGWGLPPTLGDYDNPGRSQDSWKSLVEKLERKGYSKHYANAIAGKVNKEKYPPSGRHAEDEHLGFEKLEHKLAHRKGVTNPKALAAYIGREKYGKKGMAKKAAAGRRKH